MEKKYYYEFICGRAKLEKVRALFQGFANYEMSNAQINELVRKGEKLFEDLLLTLTTPNKSPRRALAILEEASSELRKIDSKIRELKRKKKELLYNKELYDLLRLLDEEGWWGIIFLTCFFERKEEEEKSSS